MSIRFTYARLHVGYRAKDWSDVWLEPDLEGQGPEGEAELMLYKLTRGEAQRREPMEGEIKWHPLFDIKNCESSRLAERIRMQKQFFTDAYKYLIERDHEKVRIMEEELDQPGFSRWQTWFAEAQRFKNGQMKRRDATRRRRVKKAIARGMTEVQAQKEVTSDTDDSAYESDGERESASRSTSQMPPPRRPASDVRSHLTSRKRGARNGVLDQLHGKKTQRQDPSASRSSLLMSGANGSRTPSRATSISSADGFDDEVMDTSDPTIPQLPANGLRDQSGFDALNTPPATGQHPRNAASQPNGQTHQSQSANDPNDSNYPADRSERARRHEEEQDELGLTEPQAIEAAIRASMEPESVRGDDDVIDSTEADIDDS